MFVMSDAGVIFLIAALSSSTPMALYLVSCDLNKPEADYPELLEYLQLIGARKILRSGWLVRSGATRDSVYKGVKTHLGETDAVLVCLIQSAVGDNLDHPLSEI